MDGIYIINDGGNSFAEKAIPELDIVAIPYYDLRTDDDIASYVQAIFARDNIEKLIIPVSIGEPSNNHIGLKIGLHIRLADQSAINPLTPLVFLSNRSLDTLLMEQVEKFALLTITNGSILVKENIHDLRAHLMALEPIAQARLIPDVLNNLIIPRPMTTGAHSLANEWGVIRLDQITQLNALTNQDIAFRKKNTLYFKYQAALNKALNVAIPEAPTVTVATNPSSLITASGEKVLYIDDEGDKGWKTVLEKLFHGTSFQAITGHGLSEDDFMSAIRQAIVGDWDLILLDLRLLPLQEDRHGMVMPIHAYSGTKILKEIKGINPGTQVIIFTASNKAWNMKELLGLGADGYFIKESPDYLIPDNLSRYNYNLFKDQVTTCFKKIYLRRIYEQHKSAISEITFHDVNFRAVSEIALIRSFDLLKLDLFDAAYLSYFQVLEYYAKICFDPANLNTTDPSGRINKTNPDKIYTQELTKVDDNPPGLTFFEKRTSPGKVWLQTALPKLSFIFAFKFGKDDSFLKRLAILTQKRNDVAHNGSGGVIVQDFFDLVDIIKIFRANN